MRGPKITPSFLVFACQRCLPESYVVKGLVTGAHVRYAGKLIQAITVVGRVAVFPAVSAAAEAGTERVVG